MIFFVIFLLGWTQAGYAETALQYDWHVTQDDPRSPILINGAKNIPVIDTRVGETLNIRIWNDRQSGLQVHWHGLLLTNDLNADNADVATLAAGEEALFALPMQQAGLLWYHAYGLDAQKGLHGAIVVQTSNALLGDDISLPYDSEEVVVLTDWMDADADAVLQQLKQRKAAYSGFWGSLRHGSAWKEIRRVFRGSRYGSYNVELEYDAFYANGQSSYRIPVRRKGTMRLRLINASTGSYFQLYAPSLFTIVATDGIPVHPIQSRAFRLSVGETADVLLETNPTKPQMILAEAEGTDRGARIAVGLDANDSHAPRGRLPSVDLNTLESMVEPLDLDSSPGYMLLDYTLEGSKDVYEWTIDQKTLYEAYPVRIPKGAMVEIILRNHSLMDHSMHLHGSYFYIQDAQGNYTLKKNTVNVPAMQVVRIAFQAQHVGKWMFHCNNIYHLATGMGRWLEIYDL